MAAEKMFNVKHHLYNVLAKLNKMREESSLCDVHLEVENKTFPAHRNVLSAASDYFNKMFNIDMREKYQKTIKIQEVSYDTMHTVLNFIYTGDVTLNQNNVSSILKAASLLQIPDLLNVVGEFLSEVLDTNNCLLFRNLGNLYLINTLVDQANEYILENFEEISSQEMFFDLDAEEMEILLKSDELNVEEEKTVFEVVVKWINKDLQNRKQHFPSLFKNVRLQFIPIKYVAETIRKNQLVREFLDCRDLVEDAFFFHISPVMVNAETPRLSYKAKPVSVMVVDFANIWQNIFDLENKTWSQVNTTGWRQNLILPDCAVAVKPTNSYMFCGGRKNDNQISNAVIQFDGKEWKTIASMKASRCGGAAVYHNDALFVFGGENRWNDNGLRYNGRSNQISNSFFLSFEVFDDDWRIEGNMRTVRSYARAECFENKIYLFGGFILNTAGGMHRYSNDYCKIPCSSTDVYDTQSNTWSDGPHLNVVRANFASAMLDSTIYVLGGTGVNNSNLLDIELMETKDEVKVWTKLNIIAPYSLRQPSVCCVKGQLYLKTPGNCIVVCFNPVTQQWSSPDPSNTSVSGNLIIPIFRQ